MANIEYENVVVKETLTQLQGKMDLFHGNIEVIIEYLQEQKTTTSVNPTIVAIITNVTDVTTSVVDVATTIEIVVQPTIIQPIFQDAINRHVVAYPQGLPPNYASQFPNGGAFILHQSFDVPSAARIFFLGHAHALVS